jgi:putative restriction endonuclease
MEMKFYVGITDNEWFDFLKRRKPDEVNFWRPGIQSFSALEIGEPFLFKLHSPQNFIVGGGFFVRYTRLPLSMVWKVFGEENGAEDYAAFAQNILPYVAAERRNTSDPDVGCIILAAPVFFDHDNWIPAPRDWSSNIVSGNTYDSSGSIGREIWSQVEPLLRRYDRVQRHKSGVAAEPEPSYGSKYLVEARLGQGAFRTLVIDAYDRRCAISGERTVPVLEAGHIKPYKESGPNSAKNGLLLRADLHILFDEGYMTVTDKLYVEVSRRIKEEYENGREYYNFHGSRLAVIPRRIEEQPAAEYLEWHNVNVYKG